LRDEVLNHRPNRVGILAPEALDPEHARNSGRRSFFEQPELVFDKVQHRQPKFFMAFHSRACAGGVSQLRTAISTTLGLMAPDWSADEARTSSTGLLL
jgi:hypothetical protein